MLAPHRLLLALVAASVVVGACGSGGDQELSGSVPSTNAGSVAAEPSTTASGLGEGVAATVDGTAIDVTSLDAVTAGDAGPDDLADGLRRLIVNQVLEAAVVDLGITIGREDEDAARTEIVDDVVGATGATLDEVLAASGLNAAAFDLIVRQAALADAVERYLAANAPPPRESDLQEIYDEQIADRTSVCASHILLETEGEAQAVLQRAHAGEDFGDLARALSTGPSGPSGGDLGCSSPSAYVAPFASATMLADVGVPFGPVETQFGFHAILVSERTMPSLDELREELTLALLGDVFPVWLTAQIEAAIVDVAPQYGRWVTEPSPGIVPST